MEGLACSHEGLTSFLSEKLCETESSLFFKQCEYKLVNTHDFSTAGNEAIVFEAISRLNGRQAPGSGHFAVKLVLSLVNSSPAKGA